MSLTLQQWIEQVAKKEIPALATISHAEGDVILREGEPADAMYLIEQGIVRVETERGEVDSDHVLARLGPGEVLGEMAMLDGGGRSAHAVAEGDTRLLRLGLEDLRRLETEQPLLALSFWKALGGLVSQRLRETNARLAATGSLEMDPEVERLVAAARAAQPRLAAATDAEVDALLQRLAACFEAESVAWATLAVEVTGMGNVTDKTKKNLFACQAVMADMGTEAGAGWMKASPDGIPRLTSPAGVVFGLAPVTNPSSTAIFKTLSCLKSRNVLILSFARRAAAVGEAFGERIGQELRAAGWPEGLVQVVARDNSRRRTQAFFQHPGVDLILATGGPSMVRAAYASGRPALGVGAGNAPCVVLADADLDRAAAMVIASKSFDHGMVCGSEHHLVVEAAVAPAFAEALRRQGAAVLADGEAREFRDKVIQSDGLALRRKSTGQSAAALLEMAGIQRETPPPLVVLPATAEDLEAGTALAREKMAPLLSLFTAADAQDAFRIARKLLDTEGRGHTAILHSRSEETAKAFALAMPVCRVLRNCPGTHGVIGLATPLPPSLTLGCGFHGGNSVSENVTFRHLRNITHLVEPRPGFFA